MDVIRGDTIVAWDGRNQRLSFFDEEGELAREIQVNPPLTGPTFLGVADDGTPILAIRGGTTRTRPGVSQETWQVVRIDPGGQVVDTLGEYAGAETYEVRLPDGNMGRFDPPLDLAGYFGGFVVTGSVVVLSPPDFAVKSVDVSGRLRQVVRWADVRQPVSADAVPAILFPAESAEPSATVDYREAEKLAHQLPYPDSAPRITAMQHDEEGDIRLKQFRWPGSQGAQWQVVDRDGMLRAAVEIPADIHLLRAGPDKVIGVWRDSLGVEHVRIHELQEY